MSRPSVLSTPAGMLASARLGRHWVPVRALWLLALAPLVSALLATLPAEAQRTPGHESAERQYLAADRLRQQRYYLQAAEAYDAYARRYPGTLRASQAEYQALLAGLEAGLDGADTRLSQWAQARGATPEASEAYLALGRAAWQRKRFDQAIRHFERVTPTALSGADQQELDFKYGYAQLSQKDFEQAAPRFERAKRSPGPYGAGASYYAAYMALREGRTDQALTDLRRAETDPVYRSMVPLLRANLYYRQGRYDDVIAEATSRRADSAAKMPGLEDLELLAGEAYYQKRDYAKATTYFTRYAARNKSLPKGVSFRLGHVQYLQKKYEAATGPLMAAARQVDTSAGRGDTLAQQAAYYLGLSYLRLGNTQFAYNSFVQARSIRGDRATSAQAWLASGKAAYDLRRYDVALSTMQEFNQRFPGHPDGAQADEVIGESYLNTSNYEAALAYISQIKNKSPQVLLAFQRALVVKGISLYNADSTQQSARFLERSLTYPQDRELAQQARYWAGESHSAEGQWPKAQALYAQFLAQQGAAQHLHFQQVRYGIGYAHFNQREYDKALPHFAAYVQALEPQPNQRFFATALLRQADCQYATKQYGPAIVSYDRALASRTPEADYALYQKALAHNALGQIAQASAALDQLMKTYPRSGYAAAATFQKGQLAMDQADYPEAIRLFTQTIGRGAADETLPFALLKRAVAYSNLKQHDKAVADYKRIIDEFTSARVAENAILGLQEALAASGSGMEDFQTYLARYKAANPESGSTESLEFDAAKSLYFAQRYPKAVTALEGFIRTYPQSGSVPEARFYLAESHYRQGSRDAAIAAHGAVISEGRSSFIPRSLARLGELEAAAGRYDESSRYYRRLASASRNRKEQLQAQAGLMENYFEQERYDSAAALADRIIATPGVTLDFQNRATLYRGKVAMAQGDQTRAEEEFLTTLNSARDANGAEAQYLLAELLYKRKSHRESLNTLYELNRNFAQYQKWKDRGFLLIADNFIALGEDFQATATLNSIINDSPDPKTRDAAKAKLAALPPAKEPSAP